MSDQNADRPVIIFDVLGTLVDQVGSLRRHVRDATGWDESKAGRVVAAWLDEVAERERNIITGRQPFTPSHVLDAEVLEHLAASGRLPADAVAPLVHSPQRLEPWPDTIEALTKLTRDVTVMGLSNASRRVLTGLSANTGLCWHQVLSGEDASTYKPDSRIYRAALAAAPEAELPPYLVAAHAWDLRAAAKAGLRTAYVPRPNGDPPASNDVFDIHAESLSDLHIKLLE